MIIEFEETFNPRRGRVNCSLNDNGKWRWFGTQFTIKKIKLDSQFNTRRK